MPFTITMPKLSPTMEEGTIAKWLVKEGSFVAAGQVFVEIATDKASVEYAALDQGWLKAFCLKEGQSAPVNHPIAIFTATQDESIAGYKPEGISIDIKTEVIEKEPSVLKAPQPIPTPAPSQPRHLPQEPLKDYVHPYPHEAHKGRVIASPLAKRLAKEKGLDLTSIKGSGPGGRIVSQDLVHAQPDTLVTFGRQQMPDIPPGTYFEIKLTPMRKVIASRLQESKSFIPHFYLQQTIKADALMAIKEQLKNMELKVSFNDLIIRAVALALREHPDMNRGFNSANQTIIDFETIDISVAVTLDDGLITPIIRHADYKNVGQISAEMKQLAHKAREGSLQPQDYQGGSFTLSNLGMYGIDSFIAVINPPQGAILAVGAIREQPLVCEGRVEVGHTLELNLSADHRVIDGALGAQFLKTLQKLLENPAALIL